METPSTIIGPILSSQVWVGIDFYSFTNIINAKFKKGRPHRTICRTNYRLRLFRNSAGKYSLN